MRIADSILMGTAVAVMGVMAMRQGTAQSSSALVSANATQGADGKEIYLKNCKECHGVLGAPTKASLRKYDKIPDFTDSSFFKTHSHEKLLEVIEKGKGRDMKGFGDKLTKEEMKAVMEYIHTLQKK